MEEHLGLFKEQPAEGSIVFTVQSDAVQHVGFMHFSWPPYLAAEYGLGCSFGKCSERQAQLSITPPSFKDIVTPTSMTEGRQCK